LTIKAHLLSKEGWHRFGDGVVVFRGQEKKLRNRKFVRTHHPVCRSGIHPSFTKEGSFDRSKLPS
jgi:hypothetical protein